MFRISQGLLSPFCGCGAGLFFLNSLHFFEMDTITICKLKSREVSHLPEVTQLASAEAAILAKVVLLTGTPYCSPLP